MIKWLLLFFSDSTANVIRNPVTTDLITKDGKFVVNLFDTNSSAEICKSVHKSEDSKPNKNADIRFNSNTSVKRLASFASDINPDLPVNKFKLNITVADSPTANNKAPNVGLLHNRNMKHPTPIDNPANNDFEITLSTNIMLNTYIVRSEHW